LRFDGRFTRGLRQVQRRALVYRRQSDGECDNYLLVEF